MDILSDELSRARAEGAVFSVLRRTQPWGLGFSGERPLTAHILLEGSGWIQPAAGDALRVEARDVVLATGGAPYSLVSELDAAVVSIAHARQDPSLGLDDPVDDGTSALILCGAYVLSGSVGESLLAGLPAFTVIRAAEQDSGHRAAIDLLAHEVTNTGGGQQALMDRLLDLNLVYALRTWWTSAEHAPGWFRALGDRQLRPVLEAVHSHPERDWTLDAMAHTAGLSRASFASRFAERVTVSPGRYLTALRMSRAEDLLSRTDDTLAAIATKVGYSNEFAFATAFRRRHGLSPGRWRSATRPANLPRPTSAE